jgi:hypothetical protein
MYLIGDVSERDAMLFDEVSVQTIPENNSLPTTIIDKIRAAVGGKPRTRQARTTVSG